MFVHALCRTAGVAALACAALAAHAAESLKVIIPTPPGGGTDLYFRILATAGATNILLVTFLIPVSAILLGALFLGERLDRREFVGMALIFAGLAFIDGRLLRIVWGRIRPRHRSNFGRSIG